MPAPSAQYILGMLNPYAGFKPDSSGAIAIGQQGIAQRGQQEQRRQFNEEDARADEYLGFQQHQFEVGNAQKERDKRVEAYSEFSDAVTSGDPERAARAAEILGAYGVEVESYDGDAEGEGAPVEGAPAEEPSPFAGEAPGSAETAVTQPGATASPRSAAGLAAEQSPTTMVAQSAAKAAQQAAPAPQALAAEAPPAAAGPRAAATPQGKPPGWLQREMEQRGEASQGDPFGGLEQPEMQRPGPARTLSPQPEDMLQQGPQAATEREMPREDTAGGLQDIARAAKPKPGRFPSEIGGKQYDTKTGNLIRGPGDEPAPIGVSEGEAAQQRAPRRGYRIKFEGQTINIDPETVRTRQQERIGTAFDPIIAAAPGGNDKKAAEAGKKTAMELVGLVPIKTAIARGFETYDQERDRTAGLERAKYSAAGRQVSVGFNKDDTLRNAGVFDDIETVVKGFEQNDEVRLARSSVSNSQKVLDMVGSTNSVAEWAAQQQVLKEYVKGVASDRDLMGFLGSMGRTNQILKEFNAWFDNGAMPRDINRKVSELAIATKSFNEKKLVSTAKRAYDYVKSNPALGNRVPPNELEGHARNVFKRISGREMPQPKGAPGQGGKGEPKAGGAAPETSGGSSDKQKRAEELRKKMRR